LQSLWLNGRPFPPLPSLLLPFPSAPCLLPTFKTRAYSSVASLLLPSSSASPHQFPRTALPCSVQTKPAPLQTPPCRPSPPDQDAAAASIFEESSACFCCCFVCRLQVFVLCTTSPPLDTSGQTRRPQLEVPCSCLCHHHLLQNPFASFIFLPPAGEHTLGTVRTDHAEILLFLSHPPFSTL
jgi:hypothetical protein